MLRLHRHRHQAKSGEKVDFKFYGFKALQVPKGWDKLVVSIVSAETGKTVAKTSKAAARNGSCQWADTLSESIRFSEDDSAKEIEDCLFKLIVSMGSARSGILGEATVNMTEYTSTSEPVPVSVSLKKCTHGTTLQVKIQCLTPRIKSMDEDSKEKKSDLEKPNGNHQDIDIKSDGSGSDSAVAKSLTSSSANDFRLNSNPGELGSRDTSFSLSESHQSYDSAGEDMSVGDHGSDAQSLVRRADSLGSDNSESLGIHRGEIFHSKQSSFNSQVSENSRQDCPASSITSTNSAKAFREASGGTVEELRAEAKMWERNARKLMLDLDVLKAEFSDHSKIRESLSMELSAACAERDGLRKEIEQLRQTSSEDLRTDDLRFQRESNADLAMQLKRSHESNIELVSVLQDLEETVERQKGEIEELLALQSKFVDVQKCAEANGEESRKLRAQLQEMKELEKDLSAKVKLLEQVLEEKNQQIEKGKILNSQAFFDVETQYKSKLLEKEGEIAKLKAKVSDSLEATNGGSGDLVREVEELKAKVQELERDCSELTEENLDLLFKLKEAKNEPMGMSTSVDFPARTSFEFQLSEQNLPTSFAEESLERNDHFSVQEFQSLSIELEAKLAAMDRELIERKTIMEKFEMNLRSKEEEISVMRRCQSELEATVSDLQKEKAQLQEHLEVVLQESDISSKCLNDLQTDLAVLTSSVDSHSSANKLLERKSSELETGYRELELHVTQLDRENAQLSDLVVSLEAQLRDLTGQLESSQLELENSKSRAVNLSDEIDRLRVEMQSTVESLIEECDSLHRSNEEYRNEKLELHDRCSLLETKLDKSRKGFADCSKKVGDLEQHLSLVLAEFASKEMSLTSEIDALVEENLRHKEKFNQEESLLNQIYMEKVAEAEKLQQEVEHLIKKLSETHEEKERLAFDSIEELSRLRAENERLEADFEAVQFKIKQTECEFNNKEMEYEVKLKRLSSELTDSNEGLEKLSKLLENYKSSEAKFKTTVSDLELKLTVSEYQRQQHSEECSYLKAELKKLAQLEDELGETKVEKKKLEAFVHAMCEECKDLKAEKTELSEKISALKALVSELEGYKSEKLDLEEKVLQMEDELVEIEVLRVRDTELKKELSQVRKENKQYQQKIEQLQALEEEKQNSREQLGNRKALNFSKTNTKVNPVHETAKNLKNEMAKSANQRRDNRRNQSQRENGGGCESPDGSPRNIGDTGSKIQLLEDQLAKALEENSKYKAQLNKLSFEGRKGHADSLRKSTPEAELVSKAKYERTKSSLEAELRDIRERYSSMSLKYAEVEAQREELVMKLKSTAKAGKRWFS